MSFAERLKTGRFGEAIVDEFLRQKGWVPYFPIEGVAHPFDRLAASKDKKRICIVEVKTKWRREAYEDTGIDRRHYDDYQHVASTYKLPIFLVFVDAKTGTIYGNWWAKLLEPAVAGAFQYPLEQKRIVYFPLSSMRTLQVIPEDERTKLLEMRVSNWQDEKEQTPPVVARCVHKPEFIENGRCWICERTANSVRP